MSHENAFMTSMPEWVGCQDWSCLHHHPMQTLLTSIPLWREGKVFSKGSGLFESLKVGSNIPEPLFVRISLICRQEHDSIQVRLCARFRNWGISAAKAYLIFDVGTATAPPRASDPTFRCIECEYTRRGRWGRKSVDEQSYTTCYASSPKRVDDPERHGAAICRSQRSQRGIGHNPGNIVPRPPGATQYAARLPSQACPGYL